MRGAALRSSLELGTCPQISDFGKVEDHCAFSINESSAPGVSGGDVVDSDCSEDCTV